MYRGINIYKIFGCREGEMVLVTLLLMVAVYGREVVGKSADKPGSIEQLRALGITREQYDQRIEHIKADILRKLGMRAPPNMTGVSRDTIPAAIMDEFWSEQAREEAELEEQRRRKEETQKVVLIGKTPKVQAKECHNKKCMEFTFQHSLENDRRITKMAIWIYRRRLSIVKMDRVKVVRAADSKLLLSSSTFENGSQSSAGGKHGWVATNVMNDVHLWMRDNGHVEAHVRMECANCRFYNKRRYQPYLAVVTEKVPAERVRRGAADSMKCNMPGRCCRVPLSVNFKEIGWGDFILFPDTVDVGACAGSCERLADADFHYNYNWIIAKAKEVQHHKIEACCIGQEYEDVMVFAIRDDGNFASTLLNQLKLSRCSCMI